MYQYAYIFCLGEELAAVGDEGEGEAGGFVGSGVEEPPVAFGVLSEGGDVACGEFEGVVRFAGERVGVIGGVAYDGPVFSF